MSATSLTRRLTHSAQRVERALTAALPPDNAVSTLVAAMRYSSLNGGKRLRPALCFATAECFGITEHALPDQCAALDAIAAAIEMIHVYSLIHDDLPAMDNDDLRRGLPTCHKRFSEATAILAGDALQSQAFLTLSNAPMAAPLAVALMRDLALAAGAQGMVQGQAIDLAAQGKALTESALATMHAHKTGALLTASIVMSARWCGASEPQLTALAAFGQKLGLCFQIIDDILDVTSTTEVLGKTVGADQNLQKPTYPSIVGLELSRQRAQQAVRDAQTLLHDAQLSDPTPLWELARFVVERNH